MCCPKSWNFAEMGLGILGKVLDFFVGKVILTFETDPNMENWTKYRTHSVAFQQLSNTP